MKLICNLLMICVALANADLIPVLTNVNKANNIVTIGQVSNFNSILNDLKPNQKVEVILVDSLNEQDVLPLIRKANIKNFNYLPLVENPSKTLDDYINNNPKQNVKVYQTNDINDGFFKFMDKLSDSQNVLILTGVKSEQSNTRAKREARIDPQADTTNYAFGKQCAAAFNQIFIIDSSNGLTSQPTPLTYNSSSFVCDSDTSNSVLTISFDENVPVSGDNIDQIVLNFQKQNLYWVLLNGTLHTVGKKVYGLRYLEAPYGMETPNQFSFACTRTHYRLYDPAPDNKPYLKIDFFINNLQVQPYSVVSADSKYTFGKVNYCQGYFSSGIWMAITSSLLLTLILAFGVTMLLNIKTMDRFDDPKGKPLNIAMEK